MKNSTNEHDKIKTVVRKKISSSICKYDFTFKFAGFGHYEVTYTSPLTGKKWKKTVNDLELICSIKNNDEPKKVDLIRLKEICKTS